MNIWGKIKARYTEINLRIIKKMKIICAWWSRIAKTKLANTYSLLIFLNKRKSYGILSISTVFRKIYRLKWATRSPVSCARIRIQFCHLLESWNCYPSRGIYRVQGYSPHFFLPMSTYVHIRGNILELKKKKDSQLVQTLIFLFKKYDYIIIYLDL